MPQIKFAKTNNIDSLENKEKVEDKLYIFKKTNKYGKIYYDFDNDNRIEISSDVNIYLTDSQINTESLSISINNIYNVSNQNININDIKVNELLISQSSIIYIITDIDYSNNTLLLKEAYKQKSLQWNDYYTN